MVFLRKIKDLKIALKENETKIKNFLLKNKINEKSKHKIKENDAVICGIQSTLQNSKNVEKKGQQFCNFTVE